MTIEQLTARLSKKPSEDNFVERKPKSVKAHELRQALVAFSNTLDECQTAVLFIGVDDKTGAILGIDDPDKLQKRVGEAGEDCYPAIRPAMAVLELNGKRVLAVEIFSSQGQAAFCRACLRPLRIAQREGARRRLSDLLTGHCDKAAELLKNKGKYITARTINKRLGNHYPDFAPGVQREGMAQVVDVDPFTATFHLTQYSDERCIEPLSRIELDWDGGNNRRMVIVRGVPGGLQ
jgi:hypothetical protein